MYIQGNYLDGWKNITSFEKLLPRGYSNHINNKKL